MPQEKAAAKRHHPPHGHPGDTHKRKTPPNRTALFQRFDGKGFRFDLLKVDHIHRLVYMQRAWLAVGSHAIPIIDSVSCVGVLLNFGQQNPIHNRVQ